MSTPTFFHAAFDPKKKVFILKINLDGNRRTELEIKPTEFVRLAEYLGKVAYSYVKFVNKNKEKEN